MMISQLNNAFLLFSDVERFLLFNVITSIVAVVLSAILVLPLRRLRFNTVKLPILVLCVLTLTPLTLICLLQFFLMDFVLRHELGLIGFASFWQQLSYNVMVYLWGMQFIRRDLFNQAIMDGIGFWRQWLIIMWPQFYPMSLVLLVLNVLYTLFNTLLISSHFVQAQNTLIITTFTMIPPILTMVVVILLVSKGRLHHACY